MRFLIACTLLAGFMLSCTTPSVAAPPTDDQIDNAVKSYLAFAQAERRRDDPRIGDLLKGVSISEMSASQFERLGILLDLAPRELRAKFRERLVKLASTDPTADGAAAAAQIVRLIELPDADAAPEASAAFELERAQALIDAGKHPGYPAALRSGRGTIVYTYMFFYASNDHVKESGLASRLASLVTDGWSRQHLDDLLAFTQAIIAPEAGLDRAEVDRVRGIATRVAQAVITTPATDEQTRDMLLEAVGAINSAAARGELVGGPAPAMEFLWCSGSSPAKALSDLKGKVVVLDFWATWCGPCIAAFPHMREMQQRYRASPVAVVGVTSLQGWILDAKATDPAKRRVKDLSPEDELKRLAAWAKDMDMTWTVAVSKQPCFNTDYGVRGLPTVVIIDAKGVVRHAGLSPTDEKLTEYVDALLVEAGATPPARDGK